MKRAVILSFTVHGDATSEKIAEVLSGEFEITRVPMGVKKDIETLFASADAIVFVGACGIAVRMIAPHVKSKVTDPAVLVVDELGLQVISLLSGHIGGANELTRRVAAHLGAIPVITTATDINHRFAADEWAKVHGCAIRSMKAAKVFASEILKRDLPLYTDLSVHGEPSGGLYLGNGGDCGLAVSVRETDVFETTCLLIPRILHLGIGCKRGTPEAKIVAAVEKVIIEAGICPEAFADVSSIDVKADEQGLLDFCASRSLPARFYTADALNAVPGEFTASAFVRGKVGVDNVCERSAMASAGENAVCIVRKTSLDGVTVAVACEDWSVCFE